LGLREDSSVVMERESTPPEKSIDPSELVTSLSGLGIFAIIIERYPTL
jgi:hypothetical protein